MKKENIDKRLKGAIDAFAPRMLQFVDYRIHNTDAAKDIVQECFITFFENNETIQEDKIKPYLYAVARNKIKDYFKMKKNHAEPIETDRLDNRLIEVLETKDIIKLALKQLRDKDVQLISMRDIMGFSYLEIGQFTSTSLSQVKVNLFRARKRLKEEIIKLEVIYEK